MQLTALPIDPSFHLFKALRFLYNSLYCSVTFSHEKLQEDKGCMNKGIHQILLRWLNTVLRAVSGN